MQRTIDHWRNLNAVKAGRGLSRPAIIETLQAARADILELHQIVNELTDALVAVSEKVAAGEPPETIQLLIGDTLCLKAFGK